MHRIRGTVMQHVMAFLLRQDVMMCDRCGRRGRVTRVDGEGRSGREPRRPPTKTTAAIDLAALDQAFGPAPAPKDRR